jgi:hypothetical protein
VSLALGKMTEDLAIIDAGIEQLLPASPWSKMRGFGPRFYRRDKFESVAAALEEEAFVAYRQ